MPRLPIALALALAGAALALPPAPAGAAAPGAPDLRVARVSVAVTEVAPGGPLPASARVAETAGRRAGASSVRFLLSRDRRASAGDRTLGRARVRALGARATSTVPATGRVPGATAPGRYVVLACADAGRAVRERDERDNCAAAAGVVVVRRALLAPAPAVSAGGVPAPAPAAPAAPSVTPTPTPTPTATPTPTPTPTPEPANPLAALPLFVDANTPAAAQAAQWSASRPADAALMAGIAAQPQAQWLGGWLPDVRATVASRVRAAAAAGTLPVFVAYDVPGRDCGGHSAGGAASAAAYRAWIAELRAGLGDARAAVVLEPDALAQLCADTAQDRMALLADAVHALADGSRTAVYLDAGHAGWQPPAVMADRLRSAGVAAARGFSLNVSNFGTDAEEIAYGRAVSDLLGGTPFVVDTSRNGLGRTTLDDWCNPSGRALGRPPTAATGDPRVDAFLWIKNPGESDGTCNGGPAAGTWWPEQALGLAQRAAW